MDATAIAVAVIGALALVAASFFSAFFSYKAANRVKTSNGHSAGELAEFIAQEVSLLRIQLSDHVRDQEIHRIVAEQHAANHEAEATAHVENGP